MRATEDLDTRWVRAVLYEELVELSVLGLQVIARDKEDLDARWDRAVLYQEVGEHRRALACFDVIADARPGDGEVPPALGCRAGLVWDHGYWGDTGMSCRRAARRRRGAFLAWLQGWDWVRRCRCDTCENVSSRRTWPDAAPWLCPAESGDAMSCTGRRCNRGGWFGCATCVPQ